MLLKTIAPLRHVLAAALAASPAQAQLLQPRDEPFALAVCLNAADFGGLYVSLYNTETTPLEKGLDNIAEMLRARLNAAVDADAAGMLQLMHDATREVLSWDGARYVAELRTCQEMAQR